MKRIAVVHFAHEGNSFSPVLTTLEDFRRNLWEKGAGVPGRFRRTNTEVGGAVDFLESPAAAGWEASWLRITAASPSGPLAPGVYEALLEEILEDLRTGGPWDAVYLALHGSLNADGRPDADVHTVRAVRDLLGAVPIGATFDLHANVTQEQVDAFDIGIGYKCHPHTDMAECAQKCLRLLLDRADGRLDPVGVLVKGDFMFPSINARTTDGPMAEVAALARELEARHGLLDVTPFHAYAYGDSPAAGASVMVHAQAGDRATAEAVGREVLEAMRSRLDRLFVRLPGIAEGLGRALDLTRRGQGPVAVIDAADHPGAGAIADTPELFRALVAARPQVPAAFVFFFDPQTVAAAREAGVGATLEVRLGGRLTDWFGPPVAVTARVERLTDGRFVNVGPFENGLAVDYGDTAVLDVDGIKVVVCSVCRGVSDPAFFTLHGIDLATLGVLAVKAKNQFRAGFRESFREMIDIDAPGPATFDFSALPWKVAAHLYPVRRAS